MHAQDYAQDKSLRLNTHTAWVSLLTKGSTCTQEQQRYQEGDDVLQALWLHAVLQQRCVWADCQLQSMESVHESLHIKLHTRQSLVKHWKGGVTMCHSSVASGSGSQDLKAVGQSSTT
jgi:hypothetical protein